MSKTLIEASIDKVQPTLDTYKSLIGVYELDEMHTPIIDLLTDLQHYCNTKSIDFGGCLTRAEEHFQTELSQYV